MRKVIFIMFSGIIFTHVLSSVGLKIALPENMCSKPLMPNLLKWPSNNQYCSNNLLFNILYAAKSIDLYSVNAIIYLLLLFIIIYLLKVCLNE